MTEWMAVDLLERARDHRTMLEVARATSRQAVGAALAAGDPLTLAEAQGELAVLERALGAIEVNIADLEAQQVRRDNDQGAA